MSDDFREHCKISYVYFQIPLAATDSLQQFWPEDIMQNGQRNL